MEVFIQNVNDVLTRTVSKHGIIHGLDSFHGRTVKVFVLDPGDSEIPPQKESDLSYSTATPLTTNENVVRSEIESCPREESDLPYSDDSPPLDTTTRMREFIKK